MKSKLLNDRSIDPDRKYTPREAASLIGLGKKTLEKWRFHDRGPNYLKLGGRVFYPGSELIAFEGRCLRVTEDMTD